MRGPIISLLAVAAIGFACSSHASSHSAAECREGADFIRNAAMARNNGQPREAFLERLHGDLATIRSMPRALRWFARDKADELLLIGHVERVYDVPVDPRLHEAAFMADCRKTIEIIPAGQTI